jgi:hypothetical protein
LLLSKGDYGKGGLFDYKTGKGIFNVLNSEWNHSSLNQETYKNLFLREKTIN